MRNALLLLALVGCTPLVTHDIDPYVYQQNHSHGPFHSAWFPDGAVSPAVWVGHWCGSPAFEATYRMNGRTAIAETCRHRIGCPARRHGYLTFDLMRYLSRAGRRPVRSERVNGHLVAIGSYKGEALDFGCAWITAKGQTILIDFAGREPDWQKDPLLLAHLDMFPSVLEEREFIPDPALYDKIEAEKIRKYDDWCLNRQQRSAVPARPR